ncbi:MAG: SagB/ThcOx family dehydrogenase [Myxococcaceae bacterium]|nr:SagB/ThcOx family dehydrogenase [Myxococcaceae bacterium]
MPNLTRFALALMGRLRPRPAVGPGEKSLALPPPQRQGGLPLMDALSRRRSTREFKPDPVPLPLLSSLLWAGWGVNRADGNRTAPSAMDCQELDLYVALPGGAYLYDAMAHALHLAAAADVRRVTGFQDFVDDAPLDLVFVVDHTRMKLVPVQERERYAHVAAGAIAQNVALFAASAGLGTVVRAWLDRAALSEALMLTHDQQVLLAQTVGFPRD